MSQRHGLYGGIAVLSCGTVVLQIALTRLYSALLGHHFAFLSISLSLFGVGLGGVLLYVLPRLAEPPRLFARLAYLSGLAAATTVIALLVLLNTKPITAIDASSLLRLAGIYLASSLPFVLVGVAVAAAIRHAARDMSRLYLVDLVGAAIGGLVAIAALRMTGLRTFLVVAILDALASVIFYIASTRARALDADVAEERPNGSVVAAFVLASLVLFAGDIGAPWLKLSEMRWVTIKRVEFQKWNEMALITVDKPAGGMAWMRMDGSAATAILDPKTTPPLHPDEMAYVLHRDKGPVLVIGAGGGRDIRAALKYGQKDIDAAEINPLIVNDVMRGQYGKFSGGLFDKPEVHVTVADGRSYVRSSPRKYRAIVISLVDTWAAASMGALSLTENSLYTVEAFRDYIEHLSPEGTLVVNRWDNEFDRLLSLATAGLRRAGIRDPGKHMFACGASRSTALLVQRAPLADTQIAILRRHCKRHRFAEVYAPDDARTELRKKIVLAEDTRMAAPLHPTDLSAPTDDRPFFFHTVPTHRLFEVLRDVEALKKDNQALLLLVGLFVVSVALAMIFLLGPLALRRGERGARTSKRLSPLSYFFCLGLGFVFVEVALVQHFVMFLGHPVYALSAVLVALLLSAGLGSLLTARVEPSRLSLSAGRRAQLIVLLLALYAVVLGPLVDRLVILPFEARLALSVAMIAPLGLLMGSQAPLGVRLLETRSPELIPWCWGLNGVASVIATAAGTLIALQLGFSALLIAAGLSYLVAAAAVPAATAAR